MCRKKVVEEDMRDNVRDRRMQDQRLYLMSRQEQRVSCHLLTAVQLSERLAEFVSCMMKVRSSMKTSLVLLLKLKAYPVNCSTHILQLVVRFCDTRDYMDFLRSHNPSFMNLAEERCFWSAFFKNDWNEAESILQVGKDLGIPSLIDAINLVHRPSCNLSVRSPNSSARMEESESELSACPSGFSSPSAKSSGYQSENLDPPVPKFRKRVYCSSASTIAASVCQLLKHQSEPEQVVWDQSYSAVPSPRMENDEGGSEEKPHFVMPLSEIMRLQKFAETVRKADKVGDIGLGFSSRFDASLERSCVLSCSQRSMTRRSSRSSSCVASPDRNPPLKPVDEQAELRRNVSSRFRQPERSPSVRRQEAVTSVASDAGAKTHQKSSFQAKLPTETFQYESLGVKKVGKGRFISGLMAVAKGLVLGPKKPKKQEANSPVDVSVPPRWNPPFVSTSAGEFSR